MELSTLKCPGCGASVAAETTKRCEYCGSTIVVADEERTRAQSEARRPPAPTHEKSGEVLCPQCRHMNQAHYMFCLGCGGKL